MLDALAKVENGRYGGGPTALKYRDFRTLTHELETAALIARIPRKAVQHYLVFAHASRISSEELYERHGGPTDDDGNEIGWLWADLGNAVQESAEIVAKLTWSPLPAKVFLSRDLRKLRSKTNKFSIEETRSLEAGQHMYGKLDLPSREAAQEQAARPAEPEGTFRE